MVTEYFALPVCAYSAAALAEIGHSAPENRPLDSSVPKPLSFPMKTTTATAIGLVLAIAVFGVIAVCWLQWAVLVDGYAVVFVPLNQFALRARAQFPLGMPALLASLYRRSENVISHLITQSHLCVRQWPGFLVCLPVTGAADLSLLRPAPSSTVQSPLSLSE